MDNPQDSGLNIKEIKLKIQQDEKNTTSSDGPMPTQNALYLEIICICMIIVGVLMFIILNLNTTDSGAFAQLINAFLMKFFGKAKDALFLILIVCGIFFYFKRNRLRKKNFFFIFVIFISLTPLYFLNAASKIDDGKIRITKNETVSSYILERISVLKIIDTETANSRTDYLTESPQDINAFKSIAKTEEENKGNGAFDDIISSLNKNSKIKIIHGTFLALAFQGGEGGIAGSFLGTVLGSLFNVTGAYILVITIILVSFMIVSGKSVPKLLYYLLSMIFTSIKNSINRQRDYTDDDATLPKDISTEKYTDYRSVDKSSFENADFLDEDYEEEGYTFNNGKSTTTKKKSANIKDLFREPLENYKESLEDEPKKTSGEIVSLPAYHEENLRKKSTKTNLLPEKESSNYVFPPFNILTKGTLIFSKDSNAQAKLVSESLVATLKSFGVDIKVVGVRQGPTVTRYEIVPGEGVKVSRIITHADDIALRLAADGIRIEAPIPGKSAIGIEVPNQNPKPVLLRDILDSRTFANFPSKLAFGVGKNIEGGIVVTDIGKMPHLLIAGATGSGKSVCINTIITSILYKSTPDEVKFIMIDPKVVELSVYNGIPHLLIPVVTDPKEAASALAWGVKEMSNRYNLFSEAGVRDLEGYNARQEELGEKPLPQIVIIIDELSDLMMASPTEVESYICRLAQMARAAGMHLIIATQRPSVNVITGVIKANIPSRLAFSVSSGIDSRTILDMVGAEKLLGKGDMLFSPYGTSKPQRIQGAFITDKEVENLVNFFKEQYGTTENYDETIIENITSSSLNQEVTEEIDELFNDAISFIIQKEKASASMLQRQFRIGYNRAARIMDELEAKKIVGPEDGSRPRKVLMTYMEFEDYLKSKNLSV